MHAPIEDKIHSQRKYGKALPVEVRAVLLLDEILDQLQIARLGSHVQRPLRVGHAEGFLIDSLPIRKEVQKNMLSGAESLAQSGEVALQ